MKPYKLLECHFSLKTQTQLLQNCWIELFFIGYAQSSHSVSLPTVISSLSNTVEGAITQEKMQPSKLKRLSEHVWKINDFFQEINKMNLDDFEFAFLRFIVLFNPGNFRSFFRFKEENKIKQNSFLLNR